MVEHQMNTIMVWILVISQSGTLQTLPVVYSPPVATLVDCKNLEDSVIHDHSHQYRCVHVNMVVTNEKR